VSDLKAYVATDGGDGWAVVFGKTNGHARRLAADEIGCGFEDIEMCRRDRRFDAYAGKKIPLQAYLDCGWRYECSNCGDVFDSEPDEFRLDGEGFPVDTESLAPVEDEIGIYCCAACQMAGYQGFLLRGHSDAAIIEAVEINFPGAKDVQAFSSRSGSTAWFRFPGSHGHATWKVGASEVSLDQRDVQAFEAWKSAGYPVEMN